MSNITDCVKFLPVNHDWSQWQSIIAVVLLFLLDVFALILNMLILFIIVKSAELRDKTDCLLIANLAFSDFLVASSIIPFSIDTLIHGDIRFSRSTSFFIGFANFTFCIESILTLMVLVLDQTLIIKIPFWYERYRTRKVALIAILYTWVHSIVCALPPMFGLSSYFCFIGNIGPCSNYQWAGTKSSIWFTILVTLSSWGFALSVTLICYIQIAKIAIGQASKAKHRELSYNNDVRNVNVPEQAKVEQASTTNKISITKEPRLSIQNLMPISESCRRLSKSDSAVQSSSAVDKDKSAKRKNRSRKLKYYSAILKPAMTLLLITVAYFITWSPFCILLLIEVAKKKKEYQQLAVIFLWIGHSSSMVNPLIYVLRYNKFRHAVWRCFQKMYHRLSIARLRPKNRIKPKICVIEGCHES